MDRFTRIALPPPNRSSELTSIITGDARSSGSSGGGAYERKLEQDSLLSGRGLRPS